MTTMLHVGSRRARAAVALASTLLSLPLGAQETPPPVSGTTETITLSPFEVSSERDTGYVATNTLAGSRLNTSLFDTPASISVMTRDFLDDIGALNVTQAMEFALSAGNDIGGGNANVGATTGNGLIDNDFNFQIRGYRRATQTRDFFDTIISGDGFNLDRIDIARGPNSILFGIGGPGGIVNVTPKRARLDADVTDVSFVTGSWGLNRGSLDVNRSLANGRFAARVNLMMQGADGYRDFESDDQERGALALTWKATDSTTVRFGGEWGHMKQNKVRPWMPWDNISQWQAWGSHFVEFGTPQAPSVAGDNRYAQFQSGAGNGLPALPADPLWGGEIRTAGHLLQPHTLVAIMDGPLAGKVLYTGNSAENARYYRTSSGSNVGGYNSPKDFEDESVFPRRGNVTGPGQFVETDYSTVGVAIEQRVGRNLFLEVAANRSEVDRLNQAVAGFAAIAIMYDVTTTLPSFTADGRYDATIGGPSTGAFGNSYANKLGIPYVETTQGRNALNLNQAIPNPHAGDLIVYSEPTYSDRNTVRDDIRVSGSYNLDLGKIGRHTLLAFASRAETRNEGEGFREGNVHPNRSAQNHFTNVPRRVYHVDPFSSNLADRGIPDPFKNPIDASFVYGLPSENFESGFVRNSMNQSKNRIDSAAIAAHSRFFNGRLVTTAGARRDRIQTWNHSQILNSTTGEVTGLNPPTFAAVNQAGNTRTLGAVFHVPGTDWLSLFANSSTNFRDQSGAQYLDDDGLRQNREIGPLEGKGQDFGVKLKLLDGKVNATLTRFQVDLEKQVSGHQNDVFNYINGIWTTILNNGDINGPTWIADRDHPDGHRVGGTDTRSQRSEGWELEITANPTPNWRVSFNISKAENAISVLGGALSEYVERHRPEWQSKANLQYTPQHLPSPGNVTNAGGTNTVGALIQGLDNWLAFVKAQEGQIETNIRPWNANLFTAYRFRDGPLAGLTIGGGANYRGDAILGVRPATLQDPTVEVFKGGDYVSFTGMMGYEFKLRDRHRIRLQLNVDNLTNNQDKQVLASSWNPVLNDLQTFRYILNPRSYRVSATFSF
jgi:outer membrane receptor protein involved in Fe transport